MKYVKIVTFVPQEQSGKIRKALGDAGAGSLGNYTHSSYSMPVTNRFTPVRGADPEIGEINTPEEVTEERIEVICERSKAKQVIAALREAHPYEEVPFDIIPLLDEEEL